MTNHLPPKQIYARAADGQCYDPPCSPRLEAFVDAVEEAIEDDSAVGFEASSSPGCGGYLLLHMPFGSADRVIARLVPLAEAHHIAVYDPQGDDGALEGGKMSQAKLLRPLSQAGSCVRLPCWMRRRTATTWPRSGRVSRREGRSAVRSQCQ